MEKRKLWNGQISKFLWPPLLKKSKSRNQLNAYLENTQEPVSTKYGQSRLMKILDADYKPTNLYEVVDKADYLNGK